MAFAVAAAAFAMMAGPTVGVRDAGELSAAAFCVDVPHPTGFALDMALLRAAMLVPLGDVAFRANLVSALAMSLAAALAARLAYLLARPLPEPARSAAAMLPLAAMLTSRTVMRAGSAVEVYGTSLALALSALLLVVATPEAPATDLGHGTRRRAAALMTGMTLVVHTGARPAVLVALGVLVLRTPAPRLAVRRLFAAGACALIGASLVLYLPLAAARGGPIDWGDPRTPRALWAHLSAARIRQAFAHRILVAWRVPEDLARVASVLYEDLGPALLGLASAGLVLAARDRRARWVALVALGDVAYATLINPMGVADRQVLFIAEAGAFVLAVFALARAGAWMTAKGSEVGARRAGSIVVFVALACAALALWRADWAYAARADGWTASEVLGGAGALGEVPARALVLCESDDLCGVSLYAQLVEGERPDVVVLPRQHLADAPTWRRLRPEALGAVPPEPAASTDLRVARLRALLARFGPRVRWEPGEIADERLARVTLGSAETPVLAAPGAPLGPTDFEADRWLAARLAPGVGARTVAGGVLFNVGRRLAMVDLRRAESAWRSALALDPDHAPSRTNLGVVLARRGDLRGALRLTEDALRLDPDRLTAWRNLAEYARALGDSARADEAQREIQRRTPR